MAKGTDTTQPATRGRPVTPEAIKKAAIRLFGDRTYPAVGMRDLASSVGLRPGSLYAHISSKEELLHEIVAEGIGAYVRAIGEAADLDQAAPERLRRAVRAQLRTMAGSLEQTKVAFNQWHHLEGEHLEHVIGLRKSYVEQFSRIINEGIESKEFIEPADRHVTVLTIIGTLTSVISWYSPAGPLDADEIANVAEGIILTGVLPRR